MTLPLVLLNRRRIGGFNPRAIIAGSTAMVWLDPSDLTTMFQDSAGTTPVTAPAQPVGLVLDKSGNGFHATQSTAANRPTYGVVPSRGRVNLLLNTDTLATQNVTVTAAQHTLSFTGTGTVTLSGASTAGPLVGTGANNRVSLTFTPAAGTLTLTVSGSVTLGQLQLGATFNAYQRVASQFEVTDPAGFPSYPLHYLFFGGGLDPRWLQTSTITPNADKVQVFAGVRKLSDAASGMLAEFGPTVNGTAGTWGHILPDTTSAGSLGLDLRGNGTSGVQRVSTGTAPATFVSATAFDLSGTTFDTERPVKRINGAAATALSSAGSTDTGGGNFTAQVLYIGRRNGTSLAFNGQLYGLIVRFSTANLDASVISQTERWLAQKTGVTL